MAEVMPKVETRAGRGRRGVGRAVAIQVDGGIDERTAPMAAAAGADVFVAGNAIFGDADPRAAAARIRAAAAAVVMSPAKILTVSTARGRRRGRTSRATRSCRRLRAAGFDVVERRGRGRRGRAAWPTRFATLAAGFAGLDRDDRRHRLLAQRSDAGGHAGRRRPRGARPGRGDAAGQPTGAPVAWRSPARSARPGPQHARARPSGAVECLDAVLDVLPHALALLAGAPALSTRRSNRGRSDWMRPHGRRFR